MSEEAAKVEEIKTENTEAKTSQVEQPKQEQKPKIKPKLFSKPDEEVKITIAGYYNKDTGEFEFALPDTGEIGDQTDLDKFIIQKNTFVFSKVPYNRLNIYRDRSSSIKGDSKTATINYLKFRDFLWTFHFKDWDLTDDEGNKVPITHDPDGTLSSESEKMLWQVPSMILDIVIQIYESKFNLI